MIITSIQLINFKNYSQKTFNFHGEFVAFVGENGSGKTTVLDAIHYLSFTKGYINSIDKFNIRFGEDFFNLKGSFEKGEDQYNIQLLVKEGSKKIIKKNQKQYNRIADHIGFIKSVVISPYDRDLIWEGSDTRRKFLDHLISQTDKTYLEQLIKYNRALNQRNSLLKFFKENHSYDATALESYNTQLIPSGSYIYQKRKEVTEEILPIFKELYQAIAQNDEKVDVVYESDLDSQNWQDIFAESLSADRQSGFTQRGIHKDELHFSLFGNPVKRTASQGQQKTFLIALKLSQIQYLKNKSHNDKPILLLDDIFDKLDQQRVQHLVQLIENRNFGQVFIADTDKERIEKIFSSLKADSQLISLENSSISSTL